MAQNEWAVVSESPYNRPASSGWEVVEQKPLQEKQSAFRQVADIPLGIAKGAVQGVRMIADAFGAGSDTSKTIKSAETYLADLMSAQAKNDQQEISRIMKDAEDKGVLDQVKAAVKAFSVAPVDTLSSALGTAAPVIVGALGAKVLGAGALVSTGVSALTGAGMGAGTIKGSIYEETKNALKEAGASEQDAEARAKLAQEYNGKNLDQILLGTVLGGAAALGPLEKGGAAILARRILGKTGVEATESVAEQAAKGAIRRRVEAGALEAIPEAVQAGQEQVAQNIALQREGFDVPTFRGAVGAATLEGLAGAGLGATVGGGKPEAAVTPETTVVPTAPAEAELRTRYEELKQKSSGTPEREVIQPDGTKVTVPAEPGQLFTEEEQREYKRLKAMFEPEVSVEEPPAAPPVETPPVAETPPVETPPVEPPAEPPAVPPVAEAPPEAPKVVTAQMLEDIGVKPTAAIVKRLDGKTTDDPQVARELTNYAKLYAPEDVKPQILNFVQTLTPAEAPIETTEQRLVRQQQEVDVEAQRIEELNRKQGMPSPDRPKLEIEERPSIAEAPPPVTPRQELLAKQAEIDTRRLEAGLPTGAASETPGIQPTPDVAEEPKPVPKIVDERPLAVRAAKNRLLVMQNMLQNQGGDPASLTIVPHPTVEGKFAIQSLDVPTKLTPNLPRTAITRPETPITVDPVNAYVEDQRRQNTPAARQFVSDFDAGRITKADVENAIAAERKRAAPPLAVLPEGEIVAPPVSRARPTPPLEAGPPVTLQQRVKRAAQTNQPLFVTTFEQDGRNVYSVSTEETLDAKQRIEVSLTAEEQERADQAQREVDAIRQESVFVPTELTSQEQREKYISDRVAEITSKRIAAEQRLQNILRKPIERTLADVEVSKLEAPKQPTSVPPARVPPSPPPPPSPPSDQPAALPKSAFELSQRLPSIMDKADVRKANEDGDIKQLVDALKSSPNLVTRRIGELGQSIVNRVRLEQPGKLKKLNWAGQFTWGPSGEAIKMRPDHAGNEQVNAHEVVHALTVMAQLRPVTDKQKKFSQDIKDLYQHVKKELKKKGVTAYGLQDELEFTAEAMSNPNFQFELMQIPYPGKKSAWSKFVKSVADLLGITNTNALTEVMSLVEKIAETKAPRKKTTGVETIGGAGGQFDRPTANFLRWFGDSKVVDMNGEPLVVYHGSKSDITEFDPSKGAAGNQGMFFTTDIDLANVYGKDGAVYPVYVSIKNPLILQGNERFAPQGIKGKLAKLLFPAQYKKAEREQRIKDMLFDGNAGRIFSKQDVELLRREGYDGVVTMNAYPEGSNLQVIVAFEPTQIKSAIGNNGEYSLVEPSIIGAQIEPELAVKDTSPARSKLIDGETKPSVVAKATSAPTGTPGQQALETINRMGMGVKPPEPGRIEKAKAYLKEAGENPAATKESAKKTLTKWLDAFETMAFSGDAAFNNKITSSVIKDMKEQPELLGLLLEASQSQAVNADNVVSRGIIEGSIEYNEEMKKWQSVKKDENFSALAKKLDDLSQKYGTTKEEMERIAHTYLVVKRLPGIIQRNKDLDAAIEKEQATAKPDRKRIDEWKALKVYVSPEQEAQVEPGLSLIKTIPELKEVSDIWQGIRQNTIKAMVESGLWSPEYATNMFDNIDYVPYYREEQLEEGAGPLEFIRGLQVKSKEFQLKGSGAPVNDVFDNMIRWSQYAMNRAIRAQKARQMIDAAKDIDIGDRKMAVRVTEEKRGMNIVRVFRDGKQELWDMADPMFVPAFSAIQNVSIPMFKWAAKVADVLRNSVVLYPMFSVAQVPQDSFAAMFTSGLKPQHALKIPILAVKEFVKTLNKSSATHNELVKFGVVGARDFSADVMRKDAEIYAGLKPPKGGWGKTKEILEHIAMAADNAVRQAVYEASVDQGLSKAEALEKAFEIFNVRRRGTSKALNLAGQTIPFFYAYLAAQRVAYRTITGVGTSPTERKAALQTLAATSAAVFTLSMLYAMAVGDDEDYAETPAAVRDRTLTIPGTGGVRIPLRTDFFLFPKMIAEHTYLMLTDKGYEDGAKFRRSMRDALVSAVASPTPLPQVIKPALEIAINYDFFTGKPVIGTFEKQKDMERQFNDSTSEFSKLLGKTGFVSPIAADHLIRGMLGSFGGVALFMTNFLNSDPDVPRPELSWKEVAAALPGTSGFLKRPQESALKNDFYVLRDEVEKAVNTFNDIKTRSPQGMEAFLADEKQMARLMLGKPVDKINRELAKIRRQMTIITNMPENQMSAEDKADNIRQLREMEREMLKSVNVKEFRQMAKI